MSRQDLAVRAPALDRKLTERLVVLELVGEQLKCNFVESIFGCPGLCIGLIVVCGNECQQHLDDLVLCHASDIPMQSMGSGLLALKRGCFACAVISARTSRFPTPA